MTKISNFGFFVFFDLLIVKISRNRDKIIIVFLLFNV